MKSLRINAASPLTSWGSHVTRKHNIWWWWWILTKWKLRLWWLLQLLTGWQGLSEEQISYQGALSACCHRETCKKVRAKVKTCVLSLLHFGQLTEGSDFSGHWKAFGEDSWCCSCSKVWKYHLMTKLAISNQFVFAVTMMLAKARWGWWICWIMVI